ncbi:hypothetical protein KTN05_01050 [Paracoccus sp. Z118]|uniref:COG4315 family predicted lipoprotein n=1 Tax=Paracoccus sp. Z118 TaxID=2851017 RepID=UPI001C2C0D89|nr:hypothetical protein [Paracoccus sp. Z118]MBV0890437.1 hypothetical protein [Paracoccus sp. Z118]
MKIRSGCMAAAIALLSLGAAQAQTAATGDTGMTLYTFDEDTGGTSTCYDQCAENWPPYLGQSGEEKGEGWTLVERTDGTMQWAYDGMPTYYYAGDANAGDTTGDGKGGVWHVVTE